MLDSLVRVSRRVGWNAHRKVADRVYPPRLPGSERKRPTRLPRTASSPRRSTPNEVRCGSTGGGSSVPARPAPRHAITLRRCRSHLRGGLLSDSCREPVATPPRGKCARRRRPPKPSGPTDPRATPRRQERRVESPEDASRLHPFTSKRFHVLLNSLFKVLFNFPSRYLFAIGLVPVFSLRWGLPPALGCIPKQPDSEDSRSDVDAGR